MQPKVGKNPTSPGKSSHLKAKTKPSAPKKRSKGAVMPGDSVDEDDNNDPSAAAPETGVFLAREDIEELYTIVRLKTKLRIVK